MSNLTRRILVLFCFSPLFLSSTFCLWNTYECWFLIRKSVLQNNIRCFYDYLDGHDVNEPSAQGDYFLHIIANFDAVSEGQKEFLVRMIKEVFNRSEVTIPRDGNPISPPLVRPKNKNGREPLYYAILKENVPVVKKLLEKIVYLDTRLVEFARREHYNTVYKSCFARFSYYR